VPTTGGPVREIVILATTVVLRTGGPVREISADTFITAIGASFNHELGIPVPLRNFSSPSGGGVSVSPVQNFSSPSGGGVSVSPVQTFSGISSGVSPTLLPSNNFSAGIGGVVFFLRLSPPINLIATVIDSGCIQLDWTDTSPDEDGFRIERSLTGADDWTTIGTVEENIVTFLERFAVPLTVYDYRVVAFNVVEDSLPSNVVSAVTLTPPSLSIPSPPVAPIDPPRNQISPENVEFNSPGIYGLEKDENGDVTGFKF